MGAAAAVRTNKHTIGPIWSSRSGRGTCIAPEERQTLSDLGTERYGHFAFFAQKLKTVAFALILHGNSSLPPKVTVFEDVPLTVLASRIYVRNRLRQRFSNISSQLPFSPRNGDGSKSCTRRRSQMGEGGALISPSCTRNECRTR